MLGLGRLGDPTHTPEPAPRTLARWTTCHNLESGFETLADARSSTTGRADGQRPRTHHLRRHRLRTPLRLVRAPPPTTLGKRRPHRPRRRDPALLPAPPLDPRHRLQPPDPARRQHQIQKADVSIFVATREAENVRLRR